MIWNMARECMSRDELADLQGKRLVELVKYMYQNAGYYKKKMRRLGLEPGDIRGIDDLEKLPFTTKEDLMDAYPLGVFAVDNSEIVRYHASDHSAGDIGMEIIAGYTQNDIDVWKECMARSISMTGLGKKDIIQVACDYGPCADGLGAHYGAEKIGAAVIPASDCKPAASAALMRRLHVTGLVSTSSHLLRIMQILEERGWKDTLQLKAVICGGEFWTERVRKEIQDRLGTRVYGIFGLNELTGLGMACECESQKGMHIQEDFFLAEIVDTHTLLAIPGGTCGELVFTTLQKQGVPLIRYRTMQITKICYEKCECGRTMARMERIGCGPDEILQIRGSSVPLSRIEDAFSELGDVAFCVLCIRKEHNLDVADIYVESTRNSDGRVPEAEADMRRRAAEAVYRVIGVEPDIRCVESVEAVICGESADAVFTSGKVTIVDRRKRFRTSSLKKE